MDFKKISELFTVAVPLLILCSCIRLITYYNNWNIPVLDYLSVPELLFLFIQPAIIFFGLAGILFGLYAISFLVLLPWLPEKKNPFAAKSDKRKGASEKPTEPSPMEKKKTTLGAKIVRVVVLGFMVAVYVRAIWFEYNIYLTIVFHLVLWTAAILGINKLTEPERENELPSLQAVLAGTMIMLISASFFYGRHEANYTRTAPVPHRLVISDGSTIETSSDLIYLGKTSNYYFLYDNAAARAWIIPTMEVKKIEKGR